MSSSKVRSLRPKEHGAYAQLALPLITALGMGRPHLAGLALVTSALALFIAHEPLLVLLGARGLRARRQDGARAWRYVLAWSTIALGCGVGGLWLGGEAVVRASAVPLGALLVLLPVLLKHWEKTLLGEVLAGVALAAAAVPVAVAGGVPIATAMVIWGAWTAAFCVTTSAVRWVISSFKHGRGARGGLLLATVATGAIAGLSLESQVALAMVPMLLVSWYLIARPPHPRKLRRVGWSLVASTLLAAALAVLLVAAPAVI
ncbi:MAG TPA: hypothetical protein ENK23_07900 [Sorangium sp.]|nr:hypothetical protein [Sorangium sp.]